MNKDTYNKYVVNSYGRQPVMLNGGRGCTATDDGGKEYIDFTSGIGVNSFGYCNDAWAEAVTAQVRRLQHVSNLYYNERSGELAEQLCTRTGYSKVFFGNSGAEANECAIKTARKYSYDKYGKDRNVIITLQNSFHGRTVTTLSATGQDSFHNYFFPFTEGFKYVPANDIGALRQALTPDVCAIMFEYIQGESGVYPLTREYVDVLFGNLVAERDILTIADEIQTGAGRTGSFLCGERYNRTADITTLAKGLGGGLPVGACLAGEKCADVLTPGTHGSTFGANPVVAAGACAVLAGLTPELLEGVEERGRYIEEALAEIPWIYDINRAGLMIGASLQGRSIADVVNGARERGLLVLSAKERLRFLPPLNISYAEIDRGLDILRKL